jgi:hypothetical protein
LTSGPTVNQGSAGDHSLVKAPCLKTLSQKIEIRLFRRVQDSHSRNNLAELSCFKSCTWCFGMRQGQVLCVCQRTVIQWQDGQIKTRKIVYDTSGELFVRSKVPSSGMIAIPPASNPQFHTISEYIALKRRTCALMRACEHPQYVAPASGTLILWLTPRKARSDPGQASRAQSEQFKCVS